MRSMSLLFVSSIERNIADEARISEAFADAQRRPDEAKWAPQNRPAAYGLAGLIGSTFSFPVRVPPKRSAP